MVPLILSYAPRVHMATFTLLLRKRNNNNNKTVIPCIGN